MINKRGQFYLLAAIIIIGVIIGFVVISNYAERKASIKVYDLKEELSIESANVLNFGTYSELNETEMETLIRNFIEQYSTYEENIYFIFGDQYNITIISYSELEAEISIKETGSDPISLILDGGEATHEATTKIKSVIITIEGKEYEFDLKHGENFYFIIYLEAGEETHVATN